MSGCQSMAQGREVCRTSCNVDGLTHCYGQRLLLYEIFQIFVDCNINIYYHKYNYNQLPKIRAYFIIQVLNLKYSPLHPLHAMQVTFYWKFWKFFKNLYWRIFFSGKKIVLSHSFNSMGCYFPVHSALNLNYFWILV